jgi:hypothetical protein
MYRAERCAMSEALGAYERAQDKAEQQLEYVTDSFREQADFIIAEANSLIQSFARDTNLDESYFRDLFKEDVGECI